MHLRTLLLSALTAVVLITGSGFAVTQAHESTASEEDDAAIARSVRARWEESGSVDGSSVRVAVKSGTVFLEGGVRSEAEALIADDLATRVKGVEKVENRLEIVP